jgi:hypothetical protein
MWAVYDEMGTPLHSLHILLATRNTIIYFCLFTSLQLKIRMPFARMYLKHPVPEEMFYEAAMKKNYTRSFFTFVFHSLKIFVNLGALWIL